MDLSEMDLEFYPDFTRRLELVGNTEEDLQSQELKNQEKRQVKLRLQTVEFLPHITNSKGPTV